MFPAPRSSRSRLAISIPAPSSWKDNKASSRSSAFGVSFCEGYKIKTAKKNRFFGLRTQNDILRVLASGSNLLSVMLNAVKHPFVAQINSLLTGAV
jgi:hypothetical protein